jgi:hypothetical protein
LCPKSADRELRRYFERVDEQLGGEPWTLIVNGLQTLDATVWERARSFVAGLYRALGGVPPGFAYVLAILGRYPSTPFGIHSDWAANFMFMLEGEKDLLVWPGECENLPVGSPNYDAARSSADVLHASPGSMAYWMSSTWHVLESPRPSVSLHLVHRFLDDQMLPVYAAAAQHAGARGPTTRLLEPFEVPAGAVATLEDVPSIKTRTDSLVAALSSAATEQVLIEGWMRQVTGFGFHRLPPLDPQRLIDENVAVCGDPRYPVLLVESGPGVFSCSANGRVQRIKASDDVRRLVEALNAGDSFTASDVLGARSEPPEARNPWTLLDTLVRCRAARVLEST